MPLPTNQSAIATVVDAVNTATVVRSEAITFLTIISCVPNSMYLLITSGKDKKIQVMAKSR